MPFRQTPATHTPYVIIAFDKKGVERTDDPDGIGGVISKRILSELQQSPPTDLFVFSHGWQGDMGSAIKQYDLWIDNFTALAADAGKMGPGFRAARIGLHWPSKPWGDESLASVGAGPSFGVSAQPAQSDVLEDFLDRLDLSESLRGRELVGQIFRENEVNAGASRLPAAIVDAYTELAHLIGYESAGAGASSGGHAGRVVFRGRDGRDHAFHRRGLTRERRLRHPVIERALRRGRRAARHGRG